MKITLGRLVQAANWAEALTNKQKRLIELARRQAKYQWNAKISTEIARLVLGQEFVENLPTKHQLSGAAERRRHHKWKTKEEKDLAKNARRWQISSFLAGELLKKHW